MSSTLHWKPVVPDLRGGWGYPVKGLLARRYFDHDGSLGGGPIEISSNALQWMQGVKDGSDNKEIIAAMDELMNAIKEYGSIELFFEV